MKYLATALLLITATIAVSGPVGFLTQQKRSWNFIQSVGGMKVSLQDNNKLFVDCDVSGTRKVTVKPTMINSGIGVRKLRHKRVGKTIQLVLVTSVIEKGISSSCKPIDLSGYPAGEYSVEYRDPDGKTHPLGKIKLKAKKNT